MKSLTQIILYILGFCLWSPFSWALYRGTPAQSQDFKAQNTVYIDTGTLGEICTGTLIEGRYILTAAHCVNTRMTFYIGKPNVLKNYRIDLSKDLDSQWVTLDKLRATIHPLALASHVHQAEAQLGSSNTVKFETKDSLGYRAYDVALIELAPHSIKELQDLGIRGAPLKSIEFKEEQLDPNQPISTYGYGRSESFVNRYAQTLNIPELRTKSVEPLHEIIEQHHGYWTYRDQGTSQGDSGGPLYLGTQLVALTSAGVPSKDDPQQIIKSLFTNLQSPETVAYLTEAFQDFETFYTRQCSSLKEEALTATALAVLENSSMEEMSKSLASCDLYREVCYQGGLVPRHPVLGPCQKAATKFYPRFLQKLKSTVSPL